MGLDAGGGGGRCLLVDLASGVITTASRVWTHPPAPGTGGLGYGDNQCCFDVFCLYHAVFFQILAQMNRFSGFSILS